MIKHHCYVVCMQLRHVEFKGSSCTKGTSPHQLYTPFLKKKWAASQSCQGGRDSTWSSERQPTHSKVIFKKYFILYKGGIGSISAFYGLCAQFLLGDKNHRTSPWVNWGPHPCLPRRNVWGSYTAAVTEQVLSNGHSVRAEGVGKECYRTVRSFVLDPAWQLDR